MIHPVLSCHSELAESSLEHETEPSKNALAIPKPTSLCFTISRVLRNSEMLL